MSDFKDLVARDVRGECSVEEREILETNIREWIDELNVLSRDVEIQLGAKKAAITTLQASLLENGSAVEWLSRKGEHEQWRVGALRFKASVEETMKEAKTIRANQHAVVAGA